MCSMFFRSPDTLSQQICSAKFHSLQFMACKLFMTKAPSIVTVISAARYRFPSPKSSLASSYCHGKRSCHFISVRSMHTSHFSCRQATQDLSTSSIPPMRRLQVSIGSATRTLANYPEVVRWSDQEASVKPVTYGWSTHRTATR